MFCGGDGIIETQVAPDEVESRPCYCVQANDGDGPED
jgi:hypothetical protein